MAATPFSRLVSLCGLTQQEAGDFLGIARKTVAMKGIGQRRATDDEMVRLAELWAAVRSGDLPDAVPAGARERATALVEVTALLRKHGRRERPTRSVAATWDTF